MHNMHTRKEMSGDDHVLSSINGNDPFSTGNNGFVNKFARKDRMVQIRFAKR